VTENEFGHIKLRHTNIDRFPMRSAIFSAVRELIPHMSGQLLDVGCGSMPYKSIIMRNPAVHAYIGIDILTDITYSTTTRPDAIWDGDRMPFSPGSFDTVLATEVLEHCPNLDQTLREICQVLSPGGAFVFTIPFLWPLHEVPNDQARYTPFLLQRHLRDAGFSEVTLHATGGWHACLAQMLGLWARRGIDSYRKPVSLFLTPLIGALLKLDRRPNRFSESTMILGLFGIARK
jgi:SAM-dependent methyltransferase